MKLFVNVSFSVDHPLEYDESYPLNTYTLAVIAGSEDSSHAACAADMMADQMCLGDLDLFAEVEEYRILTEEEFILLEKFLPVFNITVSE